MKAEQEQTQEQILVVRTGAQLAASVAAVREKRPVAQVHGLAIAETRAVPVAADERVRGGEKLLFTSMEGVRFFGAPVDAGCWCVGAATAKAAAMAGWNVLGVCGKGIAAGLADELLMERPAQWVHWRAVNGVTGWHEMLRAAGHTVRDVVAYESVFVPELPVAIARYEFNKTMLMSAASAAHLRTLRAAARLPVDGVACVPSAAVAAEVAPGFAQVRVAQQPTLQAVLATL